MGEEVRFMKGDQYDLTSLRYDGHTLIEPVSCYLKDGNVMLCIKEDREWKEVLEERADRLEERTNCNNNIANEAYNVASTGTHEINDLKSRMETIEELIEKYDLKTRVENPNGIYDLLYMIEVTNRRRYNE